MVKQKSHGGGFLMSSHLHCGWQGVEQIGELTVTGEMSTLCSHKAWVSLMWVTKYIGDVSFTGARRFWSDKQVKNLFLISCPRLNMSR